jgi:hypothetical protein
VEISAEQYQRIEHCLPTQRGNVDLANLDVLNAVLYIAENGCSGAAYRSDLEIRSTRG